MCDGEDDCHDGSDEWFYFCDDEWSDNLEIMIRWLSKYYKNIDLINSFYMAYHTFVYYLATNHKVSSSSDIYSDM